MEKTVHPARPPVPAPVTICVISYNYGRFLADAVDSALAQTARDVTVLVVDDGSQDETRAVAASYGDRIRYHWKPNGGLSDARNVGARLTTTPWLLYLDADNTLPPDHLDRMFDALAADPDASFAYCHIQHFGERTDRTTFASFDPERLKRGNYIDAGALLSSGLARGTGFDAGMRSGLEDWDFFLTLVERGHTGALAATATNFRVHGDNMGAGVQRRAWRRRRTYLHIMFKHRRFVGLQSLAGMIGRSARHRLRRLTGPRGSGRP